MTLRLTILGCGSSAGVPRVGSGWGACDPANPKNRRRRCSCWWSGPARTAPPRACWSIPRPDLRDQLLDANVTPARRGALSRTSMPTTSTGSTICARSPSSMRRRIPVYADRMTSELLQMRFGYCFETPAGSSYPPILDDAPSAARRADLGAGARRHRRGCAVPDDPWRHRRLRIPVRRASPMRRT